MTYLGSTRVKADFGTASTNLVGMKGKILPRAVEVAVAQQMLDARQQLIQQLVALPAALAKIHDIYAGVADGTLDFDTHIFRRTLESEDEISQKRIDATLQMAALTVPLIKNGNDAETAGKHEQIVSAIINELRLKDFVLFNVTDALAPRMVLPDADPVFLNAMRTIRKSQRALIQAKNTLCASQETLSTRLGRKYVRPGITLDDLEQEGHLGLIRAIEGFEPCHGFRLYTYATPWIKQYMDDFVHKQSGDVRLTVKTKREQAKLLRIENKFRQSHGRAPTMLELASTMEMSTDKIHALQATYMHIVSFDKPIDKTGEGSTALAEVIEDTSLPDVMEGLIEAQTQARLQAALSSIGPERSLDIVRSRFGLDGAEPQTLEMLAVKYSLSRERIRQIEGKALQTLEKSAAKFGLFPDSFAKPVIKKRGRPKAVASAARAVL